VVQGLRVTDPRRLLLDVTPRLTAREFERLVAEAGVLRLAPSGAWPVPAGRPGAPELRALLDQGRA